MFVGKGTSFIHSFFQRSFTDSSLHSLFVHMLGLRYVSGKYLSICLNPNCVLLNGT